MRLHILSDLHFNTQDERAVYGALAAATKVDADIVLVAGDVDTSGQVVNRLLTLFPGKTIVVVPGNHEPRRSATGLDQAVETMRDCAERARLAGRADIHVLENETLLLPVGGETLRLVGGTFWTDFAVFGDVEAAMATARLKANDHIWHDGAPMIRAGGALLADLDERVRRRAGHWDCLDPLDVAARHATLRDVIRTTLAAPHDGPTVVMTHHLPSLRSVCERFVGDVLTPCFASHADDLMTRELPLWVHGHTHARHDWRHGDGTRVVCNPMGRVTGPEPENPLFDPALVVELQRSANGGWHA